MLFACFLIAVGQKRDRTSRHTREVIGLGTYGTTLLMEKVNSSKYRVLLCIMLIDVWRHDHIPCCNGTSRHVL